MYDNIGGKIKGLTKLVCVIEVIGTIIIGIALMASGQFAMSIIGLLVAIIGSVLAWISSWLLYGYGQLIENSDIIAEESKRKNKTHQKTVAKNNLIKQNQHCKEINAIIANPNISDDEYFDYYCPKCKAELSFTKDQLQNLDGLACPMCDDPISL